MPQWAKCKIWCGINFEWKETLERPLLASSALSSPKSNVASRPYRHPPDTPPGTQQNTKRHIMAMARNCLFTSARKGCRACRATPPCTPVGDRGKPAESCRSSHVHATALPHAPPPLAVAAPAGGGSRDASFHNTVACNTKKIKNPKP